MTNVAPQPVPSSAPEAPLDLRHPSLYVNRELSWLEFNRRVLHEALDPRTPLLERLKFLGIYSSNLDEFFQVRVAGLKRQVKAAFTERTADGLTAEEQLSRISTTVLEQLSQHRHALVTDVLPSMADQGVRLVTRLSELSAADRRHVDHFFQANVFPVLTPLAVDPGHPFPYISNLSLSIAVALRDADGEERFARVKVPKILPRWVPCLTPNTFVALEQVVGGNLEALFPGVEILGWYLFRITRNTDIVIDDSDEADDLLDLIQEEVRNRRFAEVVRLEVHYSMPLSLRQLLLAEFNEEQQDVAPPLTTSDIYEVHGLFDTADLLNLALSLDLPNLKDPPYHPTTPHRLAQGRSIFEVLREGDVLLHHPYDSFATTVERFLQAAADDPDVVAIKLTLYRTGGDSSIAKTLLQAAERGKQVAVLIEVQARFDEENNIAWAKRFEDAGVHVSYGVTGLKTHAKTLMVVRREGDFMHRYVHIGTGNYNAKTARLYTDFGLLSADQELGADLTDLFNVLTGFAQPASYRQVIVAPRFLRERFVQMIRREIEHQRAGRGGRILAKMNALVDPDMMVALYEASRAGVQVDLIIRGICCLRPGVPGVSDNIRVISIIGRFLEHSRAFYFRNGGQEEVYIGSADWMPRNLDRRIEAAVPLRDVIHRNTVRNLLELMWKDNRQAWELLPDGTYEQRCPPAEGPEQATHRVLLEHPREIVRAG
ncbi:MAG: polyphosphate kinase 1 [Gemmatimonadales bacterium]